MISRFILLLCLLLACACKPDNEPLNAVSEQELLQAIQSDMTAPSDAWPRGVPESFGWGGFGRVGWGNKPPADWTAIIPWGQVYVSADQPMIPANTKVQLRNLFVWVYSDSRKRWERIGGTPSVEGANFVEDFSNNTNLPPTSLREELDGGISVKLIPGYNFHFWSTDYRQTIDPKDIGAVLVSCEARLILHNSKQPDDRDSAFWMLSVGADYWKDKSAAWDNFKTNGDVAIGRFRRLSSNWQTVYMHTATEAQIREYIQFIRKN